MANESKVFVIYVPEMRPCELRYPKEDGGFDRIVIMPPGSETGYHTSDQDYTMTAVSKLKLERTDEGGNVLDPVDLEHDGQVTRGAGEANHNVKNVGPGYAVMMK